jgi:hypothetical protein
VESIRKALSETKGFEGRTGKITLDANGDAVKRAVVMGFRNGEKYLVTTVQPKPSWACSRRGWNLFTLGRRLLRSWMIARVRSIASTPTPARSGVAMYNTHKEETV